MNFEDQKYALFRVRNVSRDLALTPDPALELPPGEAPAPKKFTRIKVPKAEPVSLPIEGDVAEKQAQERSNRVTGQIIKVALALALASLPVGWYFDLRTQVASFTQEAAVLEQRHASLERRRQEAEPFKVEIESLIQQREWVHQDRRAPRWSPTLQRIVLKAGPGVELLGMLARGQADESGLEDLRIEGVVTSSDPRARAEKFRQMLEENLPGVFPPGGVKARLERLVVDPETPGSASSNKQKASFSVFVKAIPQGAVP